jgi:hypothetical protein
MSKRLPNEKWIVNGSRIRISALQDRRSGRRTKRTFAPDGEWKLKIAEDSKLILFVQDDAEKAAVDRQSAIVVFNEAKLPELVHEMTDARPRCADHLR